MLYRDILRTLGIYLWMVLLPLAIPSGIAIYCDWIAGPQVYPQPPAACAFLLTMAITATLGLFFWLCGRKRTGHLYRREGLLLVLLIYCITPLIGALPFYLNGTFTNPIDAFFEAVSGYTTTGATTMQAKNYDPQTGEEIPYVETFTTGRSTTYTFYGTIAPVVKEGKVLYTGIEAVSPSLLFWRSFMQCLGGGGIIVLFVAILPALGVGGKILYQTEMTGPTKESLFPRIKETASLLWKVYVGLILLQTFLLMTTNETFSLFDAITISFSTLSTGGFTPKNAGIVAYASSSTYWIITLFMILGSINFTLYFLCVRGKFSRLNDPELKIFLLIILCCCGFATWQLWGQPKDPILSQTTSSGTYNFLEALQHGSFQVVSAQTSTGFATANYDLWPFTIQVVMFTLFFVGGMAGSTAGGIKIVREQIFFRVMINKIESIFRPDTIRQYRVGHGMIDQSTAMNVLCFLMVAAFLTIIGTFLLVWDGVDPETSLSSIGCMVNNVGLAFRMGGPTQTFAFLSPFGKLLCSFLMIVGRLEYFAVLIAFVPAFWRSS